ncbi:MAG: hypothetical protein KAG19_01140, partial [Methylococcales bacterium]|nr:hypothetical protein [Methylococcales bacterium]
LCNVGLFFLNKYRYSSFTHQCFWHH